VNDQLLALTFELGVSTTTTCKTVEVFGHEGALFTTRTSPLCPGDAA
jgi:hypothetical protein